MNSHHVPQNVSDRFAFYAVKAMRWMADKFFARRYGSRAVVLETVAGVPGMVGGMLRHMRSLRRMEDDNGMIRTLLDEAENERMHLMTFIEIAQPTKYERIIVLIVQGVYFTFYALVYILSPRTAHRIVGYMEEEAVVSYGQYLKEVDEGRIKNVSAPKVAVDYWRLASDARLSDLIKVIRADEAGHRDVNHQLADANE
ncbi:MAG: alternative oxidase [Gammaproteobacteria bacterium]|nr:alternative oxidase [Gammaproteobacteria bacterium]